MGLLIGAECQGRRAFHPARIWHGYYNFTNESALVLYWLTGKYNPATKSE